MFGYVNISKNIEDGQRGLWQTFMCGLCFSTKKQFGNLPRMLVSNDINFFNVLFHSVQNVDVQIEKSRCFSYPVKKRTVLAPTELGDTLAAANVVLNYWNLFDDVVDGGSSKKRTVLKLYKRTYLKACELCPELDLAVSARYDELRTLEQANCAVLDQVSHPFAQLSKDFCRIVLGENEFAETLCYNLGKWIYLIDALDDADKDAKKHNYNPFLACYGASSRKQLVPHAEEIGFVMFAVLNRIAQSFNDLNLSKYTCILKDVLFESIRQKTKQVLKLIQE